MQLIRQHLAVDFFNENDHILRTHNILVYVCCTDRMLCSWPKWIFSVPIYDFTYLMEVIYSEVYPFHSNSSYTSRITTNHTSSKGSSFHLAAIIKKGEQKVRLYIDFTNWRHIPTRWAFIIPLGMRKIIKFHYNWSLPEMYTFYDPTDDAFVFLYILYNFDMAKTGYLRWPFVWVSAKITQAKGGSGGVLCLWTMNKRKEKPQCNQLMGVIWDLHGAGTKYLSDATMVRSSVKRVKTNCIVKGC